MQGVWESTIVWAGISQPGYQVFSMPGKTMVTTPHVDERHEMQTKHIIVVVDNYTRLHDHQRTITLYTNLV